MGRGMAHGELGILSCARGSWAMICGGFHGALLFWVGKNIERRHRAGPFSRRPNSNELDYILIKLYHQLFKSRP